jgi:site-specific recombinase XerD
MGRKSQIPELEAKLGGVSFKHWLTERVKEGKSPTEIKDLLGVSLSQGYDLINEFGLKDVMKQARKAMETGIQGELRTMFDDYYRDLEIGNRSDKTIINLKNSFGNFLWWLNEFNRPCTLANFTTLTCKDFLYYCQTTAPRFGGKSAPSRRPLQALTLISYRAQLHAFGTWLEQQGKIERGKNPVDLVPKIKKPKREPEDLSDETVNEILNSFDESDFDGLRNKSIILFFIGTGMRLEGVEQLKADTFNLETGEGRIIEKGNKERPIILLSELREQLKKYMTARVEIPDADKEWLWITREGKRFTRSCIKTMVQGLKRFDKRVHPHLFRKLFTKAMVEGLTPVQHIMTMGGWSNLQLVMKYAEAYAKKKHWDDIDKYSPLKRYLNKETEVQP